MSEEINFESLNIKIPETLKTFPLEKQKEIFEYLRELDEHNKKAYEIALDHLGTSFNIYRSNGFKEWKQSKNYK
jgi:phage-related protein